jgi:hypothetical protein
MKKLIMILLVVVAFAACGLIPPPTLEEQAKADYGIAPENPKEQVAEYLKTALFDPMTAVIEWQGDCVKGWWWVLDNFRVPHATYGWKLTAKINAKNRMGGYVGFSNYTFCFRDGKLTHTIS